MVRSILLYATAFEVAFPSAVRLHHLAATPAHLGPSDSTPSPPLYTCSMNKAKRPGTAHDISDLAEQRRWKRLLREPKLKDAFVDYVAVLAM